jgi:hypothetical protein
MIPEKLQGKDQVVQDQDHKHTPTWGLRVPKGIPKSEMEEIMEKVKAKFDIIYPDMTDLCMLHPSTIDLLKWKLIVEQSRLSIQKKI